jgi:hypothetical protein
MCASIVRWRIVRVVSMILPGIHGWSVRAPSKWRSYERQIVHDVRSGRGLRSVAAAGVHGVVVEWRLPQVKFAEGRDGAGFE